jgi:hypothetical protein
MSSVLSIRGSCFVNTPISVKSNGSIKINFIDTNIPQANQLNAWLVPKYCLLAKPMDLAIATGGLWLTHYGTVNLPDSIDIIKITGKTNVLDLCDTAVPLKLVGMSGSAVLNRGSLLGSSTLPL